MNFKHFPPQLSLLGLFILLLQFSSVQSQVGINTTSPDADAMLDIVSSNRGALLPRVNLTTTAAFAPLSQHVEGMLVYNLATVNDVTPGYYYNDGSQWIRMSAGSQSDDWKTTGNAGTTAGTNFIGTTDGQDFVISTNNTEEMRVLNGGQVAINTTAPIAGDRFTVVGDANEYAINAYAAGAAGIGIYGESPNFDAVIGNAARYGVVGLGTYGIYGTGANGGVYGVIDNATGFGMVARNINTAGVGILVSGTNAPLSYLPSTGGTFNGILSIAGFSTNASGTGISGIGNASTTSRTLTSGSGIAGSGITGVYGITTSTTGTGIIGVGNFNTSIAVHSSGSGIAGSGSKVGVFGYAGEGDVSGANEGNVGGEFVLDADNDPLTDTGDLGNRARARLAGFDNVSPDGLLDQRDSYYGGYFSGGSESSGTPSYAYVGMRYRTNADGDGFANGGGDPGADYKIIGTGVVSTLIEDQNGIPRVLFAPEAPEVLFQDFGVGQLINGEARVQIDPILKNGIVVDQNHPLKVYVTLEGDCNGIYVTDKSINGFTVKELKGGASNTPFSWQIVANRKNPLDNNGRETSNYVDLRLPVGPGPIKSGLQKLETSSQESQKIKEELPVVKIKNQLGTSVNPNGGVNN